MKFLNILNLNNKPEKDSDNVNHNMFDAIDSNEKAYLLGYIANNKITELGFTIYAYDYDKDVLERINKMLFLNKLSIYDGSYNKKSKVLCLNINSKIISEKLMKIFKINNINEIIKFPDIDEKYLYYFIRGVFESSGYFIYKSNPVCGIVCDSNDILEGVIKRCNLKCDIIKNIVEISGNSALDFLNKIYKDVLINREEIYMNNKYNFYKKISGWIPDSSKRCLYFNYVRTSMEAVPPYKHRASDSGYDLTLIKKIKTHGNVEFYDTCIKIQPVFGYYFDLVGRSSISKSGYMLANNIGIIDRTYQGTVIVPLIKIDHTQPDLELPCKLVQIIPRQIQHLEPIEITEDELLLTDRNEGGFGSTGK